MTSTGELWDKSLEIDIDWDTDGSIYSFEGEVASDDYYRITCYECMTEEFLSSNASVEAVNEVIYNMCDCNGENVKDVEIAERIKSVFTCGRCGNDQAFEKIGKEIFCNHCAKEIRNYIQ